MNASEQQAFWALYERRARGPIDRACRSAARTLSDNQMDPADLIGWVDRRVWRMLERRRAPFFHERQTPEQAVERIIRSVTLLARWAYLAHCRTHWRREARERAFDARLSRAERLAMACADGRSFEATESVRSDLQRLKKALDPALKQKLAASWQERGERKRIALALGATREEDDALVEKSLDGSMRENTVQQMRSRARRRVIEIFEGTVRSPLCLALVGLLALATVGSVDVLAGEQSGGRKGGMTAPDAQVELHASDGEQAGGRGG